MRRWGLITFNALLSVAGLCAVSWGLWFFLLHRWPHPSSAFAVAFDVIVVGSSALSFLLLALRVFLLRNIPGLARARAASRDATPP